MRKVVLIIGMAAAFYALAAAADDSDAAPISAKRQMVICMTKSMSANKTLSYNDAQRDCKERSLARAQGTIAKRTLAANAADAPALKTP
jgi:hypothetical protein